ncbi:hypothetical protein IV203_035024 [Nitzschia inconspicua]|uniref:Uncharacterized protein n=1 Tax=Nitzschia inconspicua TaxID=303405 RepID=A0A9K3LFF7_9STRA|nr:hypothetical protein IV203_035024 [Nitzschia inconspicua]
MADTPLAGSSVKPPGRMTIYVIPPSVLAYKDRTSSPPLIFSSMIPPSKFRNLYTAESGLVTPPQLTITR